MALPEKLHKRSEDDYVLYDEEDNRIKQSTYQHWYDGKKYLLIWEKKYDPREIPCVYLNPDSPLEYTRISDENLIDAITEDFWGEVSSPLQPDGPVWLYQQGNIGIYNNGMGMMTIVNAMANAPEVKQEEDKKDTIPGAQ